MAEAYTSAVKRLADLPEVFSGTDLTVKFKWTSGTASSYLAQWKKSGLVKSLGGRSDVHMNLVVNRMPNTDMALRYCYPRAVRIGLDVLRQAGWMTQIPTRVDVAISKAAHLYDIQGYNLSPRTEKWFEITGQGTNRSDDGIDSLRPAWTLADMIARAGDQRVRDAWLPDPEDLDEDIVLSDPELPIALKAFGLDPIESYENVYQEWAGPKFQRSREVG